MKELMLFAAMGAFLAGCQTEQPKMTATVAWLQSRGMSESEAKFVAHDKALLRQYLADVSMSGSDDQYCRSLGAAPGSPSYVNCRTSRSASRPQQQPKPKPLDCTSRMINNTVRTTCE